MTAAPLLQGLPPVLDRHTRLLVLGSFPGAASLAAGQYYAHPRNHFWAILAELWQIDLTALSYRARLVQLLRHRLGLWDVYAACHRVGSLDSAIEQAQPNDLSGLREAAPSLAAIAHNGGESARSMRVTARLGLPVHRLPSTSPANASWSFERKRDAWRDVLDQAGVLR